MLPNAAICNYIAFINDRQSLCRQHSCSSTPDITIASNPLHVTSSAPIVHVYSNRQRTTIEPPFNVSFGAVPSIRDMYCADCAVGHTGKNRHAAWCIVVYGHFSFSFVSKPQSGASYCAHSGQCVIGVTADPFVTDHLCAEHCNDFA